MAINDIFQLAIKFVHGSDSIVNVMHYEQTAWDDVMTQSDLCDNVSELYTADIVLEYKPILSAAIDLVRIDTFVVNAPTASGGDATGAQGDVAGDVVAIRSAPVVTKLTALRGRSFRGRLFLPPVLEAQQASGVLNAMFISDLDDFFTAIKTLSDGAGNVFRANVYSPTLSDPIMETFVSTQITSFDIKDIMGSQRGRQAVNPT